MNNKSIAKYQNNFKNTVSQKNNDPEHGKINLWRNYQKIFTQKKRKKEITKQTNNFCFNVKNFREVLLGQEIGDNEGIKNDHYTISHMGIDLFKIN